MAIFDEYYVLCMTAWVMKNIKKSLMIINKYGKEHMDHYKKINITMMIGLISPSLLGYLRKKVNL